MGNLSIDIYSDGSCLGNPGPGGYAAILLFGENSKIIKGNELSTTNNRMELTAVKMALLEIKKIDLTINVYLDSNYVYEGITSYINSWLKNNWLTSTKQPVKNQDLRQDILILTNKFTYLNWFKVEAHTNNHYNNLVDKIAKNEAKKLLLKK